MGGQGFRDLDTASEWAVRVNLRFGALRRE